jgi:hypothetical protein
VNRERKTVIHEDTNHPDAGIAIAPAAAAIRADQAKHHIRASRSEGEQIIFGGWAPTSWRSQTGIVCAQQGGSNWRR